MDHQIIEKINRLWDTIYPHLTRWIADIYGQTEGDILELGPFSGGIGKELLALSSGFRVVISGDSPELFLSLQKEVDKRYNAQRMIIMPSPLAPLIFMDKSFDLVIFRGAFFFLTPAILQEVFRVLRPGGVAVVGGGYSPSTPPSLIQEIAEESKRLNALLGKRWINEGELTRIIQESSIGEEAEISHEGGLWVILRKKNGVDQETLGLVDALTIRDHEIISLVGAGGKTSLMFTLARELQERGLEVITTTTTKIYEPTQDQTPVVVIEKDGAHAMTLVKEGLRNNGHVTVAATVFPGGKIGGVDPEFISRMARELSPIYIIVEADGARRLPLKAPGGEEPVLPPATSLVIPMVGIDCIGRPLNAKVAFRPERIAELTGTVLGGPITSQLIARLITHPQGLIKGVGSGMRVVPVINKVETTVGLNDARRVAHEVIQGGDSRIERVVLSRLFSRQPIVEIVQGED